MNGAELPDGSVLFVQPSGTPESTLTADNSLDKESISVIEEHQDTNDSENHNDVLNEDNELDDFFDSL
jgi:hypothetical protein